jgi:hypothetical protein
MKDETVCAGIEDDAADGGATFGEIPTLRVYGAPKRLGDCGRSRAKSPPGGSCYTSGAGKPGMKIARSRMVHRRIPSNARRSWPWACCYEGCNRDSKPWQRARRLLG